MDEVRIICQSDKLPGNIQKAFEEMRKNRDRCDLIIKTGEKEFPVHKLVMAATSDFFSNLTQSDFQNPVILDHIRESTMDDIIHFCYTSKLYLSAAYATEVLEAASKLKMKDLIEFCVEYLDKKVSIENYGQVLDTITRASLTDIPKRTLKLVLNNFDKVAVERHLLKLNANLLVKILSSDGLKVNDEELVMKVVRDWFDENPQERASSLDVLLDCIRFALFTPKKLLQLRKEKLSFENVHFLDLVNEAIDFQKSQSHVERYEGSVKARARHPTYFEPGSWIFIVYEKRKILKYDLFHNTYTDITFPASTPQKSLRTFLGGAIIENKLYIVDDYGTVEIYDILNNQWDQGKENKKFWSHSSGAYEIFAAGHFIHVILEESLIRFDSRTKTWKTIAYDVDEEEMFHHGIQGACSFDDEALVIFNWEHEYGCHADCSISYKYTQSRWENVGYKDDDKLVARGKFISFDGKLYSPQGRRLVCLDKHLQFYELPKMALRRHGANLFEIGGQIVVYGGEPMNTPETLERFNPRSEEWSTIKLNVPFDGVVDVVKYVREIE